MPFYYFAKRSWMCEFWCYKTILNFTLELLHTQIHLHDNQACTWCWFRAITWCQHYIGDHKYTNKYEQVQHGANHKYINKKSVEVKNIHLQALE